jgi:hypothetical protein
MTKQNDELRRGQKEASNHEEDNYHQPIDLSDYDN